MRSSAGVLLLCCSLALARDPFQPPSAGVCQQQVAAPDGWRLQGIVGSSTHYVAWLVSPQGKSYRLTALAMLPHSPWQVTALTARSLILRATQSCLPQQITWVIKGGFYEKDDAVVLPEPPTASQ